METQQEYEQFLELSAKAKEHRDKREYKEAEGYSEKALEIVRRLAEINPTRYTAQLAVTLNNHGDILLGQDRLLESCVLFRESWNRFRKLPDDQYKDNRWNMTMAVNNYMMMYTNLGLEVESAYEKALGAENFNVARKLYKKALNLGEKIGLEQDRKAEIYLDYGILLQQNKLYADAGKIFNKALDALVPIDEEHKDRFLFLQAKILSNIAFLKDDLEDYEESERLLKEAIHIYEDLNNKDAGLYDEFIEDLRKYLDSLYGEQ